ncbi:hypothetical protein pb186bvf_006712 [Paramecium bursaria]
MSQIYDSQEGLLDFRDIFKQNDVKEAFNILQSLGGGDQIVKKLLIRKETLDVPREQKVINGKYGPNFQGFQEISLLNLLKSMLNYQQLSLILFGICLGTFNYLYKSDILVSQIYIFESYILISLIIPLINSSYNQKKQVQEMNRENYYTIKVLDQGEEKIKYYKELVEGDIVILEPTNQLINVDGLLILGNITVDESLITGDSVTKIKSPYEQKNINIQNNPFIYSGSRILEGKGQMIVLTAGINTQYFKHKINKCLQQEVSKEQIYIDKIMKQFFSLGIIFMVVNFGIQINFDLNAIKQAQVFQIFLIIIVTLSIQLTVFPISLQLILNIIKPKIIQQLNHDNITVHNENCLDKIQNINYLISEYNGIFTENCLKVLRVHIGGIKITKIRELQQVSDNLSNHFIKCCFYTTTCIQKQDKYLGDQFECALLKFISKLHNNIQTQRIQDYFIKQYNQFKTHNYNITVVKIANQYIQYVTGHMQAILPHCQQSDIIEIFQNQGNILVMAYKILNNIEETNFSPENLLKDLNLISIIEFQDPTIANIDETLGKIRNKNLQLIILTNQNIQQMKSFASQYLQGRQTNSILTGEELRNLTGGVVRDGKQFTIRFFDEFLKIIHNLRIVAEANNNDRLILNVGIQQMHQNVAVIAISQDLANLRLANLGIILNDGIQDLGYEPDIQIHSKQINDIFKVMQWSSVIRINTRRIIQFQIPSTITITVGFLILNYIVLANNYKIIFFNQIIWINVIINGLLTFSINSEPPSIYQNKNQFILTTEMAKHILFSLILQLAVIISLLFLNDQYLQITEYYSFDIQRITITYQTLVLLQIFGSISVKFNFNKKINNPQFFIFVTLALLSQYIMICIVPEYFQFCFLTLRQHLFCLIIGVSYTTIVGIICLIVPTRWFNKIIQIFQKNVNQNIPQMNKSHSIEMSQSLKEKLLA